MARRRFFVHSIEEGHANLTGDDAHHLARVLRAETGQVYEIVSGGELFLAEIVTVTKSTVRFRIVETLDAASSTAPITLVIALIKFDRLEWLVEKATELGVERILPVEAARSDHGLLAAAGKRVERWRKLAREASQQCRRVMPPEIAEAIKLTALPPLPGWCARLEEQSGPAPLLSALTRAIAPYNVLIGPEGGWTDPERERLSGWLPVSLGPSILRAETAGLAAAALLAQWHLATLKQ